MSYFKKKKKKHTNHYVNLQSLLPTKLRSIFLSISDEDNIPAILQREREKLLENGVSAHGPRLKDTLLFMMR